MGVAILRPWLKAVYALRGTTRRASCFAFQAAAVVGSADVIVDLADRSNEHGVCPT